MTDHMTVGELRELLATMGSNDEERNAPVLVNINQTPTPLLKDGELLDGPDWTSDIPGPFLLLQADTEATR